MVGYLKATGLASLIFMLRGVFIVSPVLDELAVEYDGKIDFYKVDVDQEPLLESAFSIRTIPNLLFVPVEGTPWMKLGTIGKPQLKKMLDDLLAGIHE